MEHMKELLTAFEEILDRKLEEKLEPIYERLDCLEERVRETEVILEKEIRPNIQVIAGGHFDIKRRFESVYELENKWMQLVLRVNCHEALLRGITNCSGTKHISGDAYEV